MKIKVVVLVFIQVLSVSSSSELSYRYPCFSRSCTGFCVPQRECCENHRNFCYNGRYWDHLDHGNCSRNEYCCISGNIKCQSCDEGTEKVNGICVDINECEQTYGLCSGHKCINTYGNYTCECFDSYQMIGNLKTCQHMNQSETADLLFSASLTINLMQLNRKNKTDSANSIKMIYSGTVSPRSIDYSFSGNYMAWTDIALNQINIAPINDDNPSLVRDRLILRFVKNPISVAIDWIHNLLYWTDLETRTINVANIFRPNDYYIVINATDQEPHDLVVNVLDNVLVWNHIGLKPRLMRSFQDGTNQSILYSTHKQAFCITIDVFLKRYYFIDIEDFTLYSINFEGTDERKIFSSRNIIRSINSMNVYHDEIFMSTDELIFKMNKFAHFGKLKGIKAEALVKSMIFRSNEAFDTDNTTDFYRNPIYSFRIVDPILQPEVDNKCFHAKCSHLCLPSDRNKLFRCICPINTVLVNSTVCTEQRFKALVMDSISWESDLQKLIDHSISKSIDLRKLLNQSFVEQVDLNKLFNSSFEDTLKMRQLFDFTANQSLDMKKSFIKSLKETLFWKKVLNSTLHNNNELEKLLNQSLLSNDLTQLFEFISNLTESNSKTNQIIHSSHQLFAENNNRNGEQVILSFILIGIFVIIILFLLIGVKLKLINFNKNSLSSTHREPLFQESQDINLVREMESKT